MPRMASPVQVKVKHNGKTHEVSLNPASPASAFRDALYQVTGVPPERQKVMIPKGGGMLKDDSDMTKLAKIGGLNGAGQGQTFMLIGTAGELPKAPAAQVTFVEDMTDTQLALATKEKAGLTNLGNTCYLNSTLQVLRAIPELQVALGKFGGNMGGMDGESNLTASLRDLYKSMNETTDAFPPLAFLTILRQVAPQFAEMARPGPGGIGGGYAQQDAEEVWIRIINALQNSLPGLPGAGQSGIDGRKFVQQYMTGEMVIKRSCPEAPSEEPTTSRDTFTMLQCNISGTTNEMLSGISDSLTQQIEKNSPSLGRTAVYDEQSRISRLPAYLACHFVRFYWRRDINKKTKIMRKVKFPFDLDAGQFLSDELKDKVRPAAVKIKEVEKARDERTKVRRRAKAKKDAESKVKTSDADANADPKLQGAAAGGSGGTDPPRAADGAAMDTAEDSLPKDKDAPAGPQLGAALTEEEEFALRDKEAAEVRAAVHADLAGDVGANTSGLYELVGIVTHKGAAADAGHYISWVRKDIDDGDVQKTEAGARKLADMDKQNSDEWYKFDDDKVSTVSRDKIAMLDGGGEDSVAYILLYRSKQIN